MVGLSVQSFGKSLEELASDYLPSREKLEGVEMERKVEIFSDGLLKLYKEMFEQSLYEVDYFSSMPQMCYSSDALKRRFEQAFNEMIIDLPKLKPTTNRVKMIALFGSILRKEDELNKLFNKYRQEKEHSLEFAKAIYPALKLKFLDEKKFELCAEFTGTPEVELKAIIDMYDKRIAYAKLMKKSSASSSGVNAYNPFDKSDDEINKEELDVATNDLFRIRSIYENSGRKDESVRIRKLFIDKFGGETVKEHERIEEALAQPVTIEKNCFVEFREVVNKASDESEVVKFGDNREAALNLSKTVHVSSKDIDKCQPTIGHSKDYLVNIRFTTEGAKKFGKLTEKNVGKRLAIVVNGEIMSAPTVNEAIYGGSAQITGDFNLEDARNLAASINANCGENYKGLKDKTK